MSGGYHGVWYNHEIMKCRWLSICVCVCVCMWLSNKLMVVIRKSITDCSCDTNLQGLHFAGSQFSTVDIHPQIYHWSWAVRAGCHFFSSEWVSFMDAWYCPRWSTMDVHCLNWANSIFNIIGMAAEHRTITSSILGGLRKYIPKGTILGYVLIAVHLGGWK